MREEGQSEALGAGRPAGGVRVLVNALALGPGANATRIFLENVLARLPDAWPDAKFIVLARRGGPDLPKQPRMRVVRIRSPRSGIVRVLVDALRTPATIARLRPEVVISPNESIPRRSAAPIVVVAQNLLYHCPQVGPLPTGPLPARLRSRLQFAFYRHQMPRAYDRAAAVVAVSAHAVEVLATHAGLDRSKAQVVPCGGDRLPLLACSRPAGQRTLLVVGSVAHYKRIETAIGALEILRRDGSDYQLLLVGGQWPGQANAVKCHARRGEVSDHVKLLGEADERRLAELLATSHACLALSACESFGIPVIEAMRAGLPVVAADEPWIREIAGDAAIRALPSAANVAAAVRLLDDAAEWRRRAEAGRRVARRYTWAANAAGIASVAARLVEVPGA